ncbi:MAG: flagellar hook-associated protein FlgK [Planctomycetota bacterium]|nr:MAG: flagellar hook-associated protein FlgK [Planctomycetota bacterium]
MGLGFGFDSGLRGLTAARMQMQLSGHNIANVSTKGYSRQNAVLSSSLPATLGRFQIGTGVDVTNLQRIVDGQLNSRLRTQQGIFGKALIDYRRSTEIEGILGEPGPSGISNLFGQLFGDLGKLQTDPASTALRGGFVQSAKALTSGLNLLASRLGGLQSNTFAEISTQVKNVNEYASRIAELNKEILSVEANGTAANDLRDQRDMAIQGLSDLMDTRVLERNNGVTDILAGGHLLVSGGIASQLVTTRDTKNTSKVLLKNNDQPLEIRGGRIGALLHSESKRIPELQSKFNALAFNGALEFNRLHTTGLPRNGGFKNLVSENPVRDGDGDGKYDDELLAYAGLPFEISRGELYISVTNESNGDLTRKKIDIDPLSMTVGDFADELSKAAHVSATVDPTGRIRISASDGYRFDFSNQIDSSPNSRGTLSGKSASLGGSERGPFDFSSLPANFTIAVDGAAPTTITLNSLDFNNPSKVEAEELSSVLKAKFNAAGVSADAVVVGDSISLLSTSSGTSSSLSLVDGANSPLATLGLPVGITAQGQDNAMSVSVMGTYTGESNGHFRFVPDKDGEIGVTPGLTVGVFDQTGTRLATLNVGKGYSHGDRLDVAHGLQVSFGPGELSATNQHQFALDTLADPDSSDVLVGFGINTFFTGSTAADLGVSSRISSDPNLFAASLKPNAGDGANLIKLLQTRHLSVDSLDNHTLESYYSDIASSIGFETKRATELIASEEKLLSFLHEQRENVSGVNIDEEMVNLVKYQQAFQASSRFINVVNQMTDVLINIGR